MAEVAKRVDWVVWLKEQRLGEVRLEPTQFLCKVARVRGAVRQDAQSYEITERRTIIGHQSVRRERMSQRLVRPIKA